MAKVLITGGAGFLGYHLAAFLMQQGDSVTLAGHMARTKQYPEFTALFSQGVTAIEADLTEAAAWENLGGGYDHVYHLLSLKGMKASKEIPHEMLRVGMLSTMHALEWFRTKNGKPGAKILYASSNEAYAGTLIAMGGTQKPSPEKLPLIIPDPYDPRWSYAAQKILGEMFFIDYAKAYNLRMTILRLHNVYGPKAGYEGMIPVMIERVQKKTEPFPVFGPDEIRSFCYVVDAVEAMAGAMRSSVTDNGTYNVGSAEGVSITEFLQRLFDCADWHPKSIVAVASPAGSVTYNIPDITKVAHDIGWEPKTDLTEGLRRTYEWYATHPRP